MREPERLAAEAATDAMVVEAEAVVRYGRAAQARRAAMDAWMWSDATGCWHDSWLNVPPAQLEDTAASARLVPPTAQAASTHPGAPPEQLGSVRRPQSPASSGPKVEDSPLFNRHRHDVLWERGEHLPQLSAASFTPLWAGAHGAAQARAAVGALRRSGLLQPGGLATTLVPSGQQWDWPNAWPPLQQMAVEGLAGCGAEGAAALAEELAVRWLRSNHRGWARDGVMREKYDATRPGESGGGGEYVPQDGFGWTNGVALWLLDRYGDAFARALREDAAAGPESQVE